MSNESFVESKSVIQQTSSIGTRLKHAREALRLSSIDIARQLRLKPEYIDALEQDNYTDMPGPTFAKGYLRAYARLVNLSGDDLIAEFNRLKLMPESSNRLILPEQKPVSFFKQKSLKSIVLIGLGLFIFIVLCWNFLLARDTSDASVATHQPLQNGALSGVQATPNVQNGVSNEQQTTATPSVPSISSTPNEKSAASASANANSASQPVAEQNAVVTPDTKSSATGAKKEAKPTDDDNNDANADSESAKPIKKSAKAKLAEPFE